MLWHPGSLWTKEELLLPGFTNSLEIQNNLSVSTAFICKLTYQSPIPLLSGSHLELYPVPLITPRPITRQLETSPIAYQNDSNYLTLNLPCPFLPMKTKINPLAHSFASWPTLGVLHVALHDLTCLVFLWIVNKKVFFKNGYLCVFYLTIPDQSKSQVHF